MSYKTKPYIFLGAGSGARMLKYEFTKDRKLIISGLLGIQDTISLEGAGAKRADEAGSIAKIFRKLTDIGDVLVEAKGKQRLCKRINGVQAFIQAVEGTHPAIRPLARQEESTIQKSLQEKEPNRPGLSQSPTQPLVPGPSAVLGSDIHKKS
jgi:hypothetical protein